MSAPAELNDYSDDALLAELHRRGARFASLKRMLEIRGAEGVAHFLSPLAVAGVSETSASSQWHGVRAIVKLHDGSIIEALDTARSIASRINTLAQ